VTQKRGRIVVGVDGSEGSKSALRWAAGQTRLTGAALEAVTAWESPAAHGWAPVYAHNRDHDALTKKVLSETIAATLGDSPVADITLIVAEGQPAHVILTASQGADLLVVGSRGRGGFAGLVLGSVSQHCVQHAPCPVVVIPPEAGDKG
jgi:nucleotide-binding universal stress UspA family protein